MTNCGGCRATFFCVPHDVASTVLERHVAALRPAMIVTSQELQLRMPQRLAAQAVLLVNIAGNDEPQEASTCAAARYVSLHGPARANKSMRELQDGVPCGALTRAYERARACKSSADEDRACIVATSGSTGEPKYVALGATALLHRLCWNAVPPACAAPVADGTSLAGQVAEREKAEAEGRGEQAEFVADAPSADASLEAGVRDECGAGGMRPTLTPASVVAVKASVAFVDSLWEMLAPLVFGARSTFSQHAVALSHAPQHSAYADARAEALTPVGTFTMQEVLFRQALVSIQVAQQSSSQSRHHLKEARSFMFWPATASRTL